MHRRWKIVRMSVYENLSTNTTAKWCAWRRQSTWHLASLKHWKTLPISWGACIHLSEKMTICQRKSPWTVMCKHLTPTSPAFRDFQILIDHQDSRWLPHQRAWCLPKLVTQAQLGHSNSILKITTPCRLALQTEASKMLEWDKKQTRKVEVNIQASIRGITARANHHQWWLNKTTSRALCNSIKF